MNQLMSNSLGASIKPCLRFQIIKTGLKVFSLSLFGFILLIFAAEIGNVGDEKVELGKNWFEGQTYFINLIERKYLGRVSHFDEQGVPIYKKKGIAYYHPVYIMQFALGAHDYYLETSNSKAKEEFLKCSDWLRDNLTKVGKFSYWEYRLPNPHADDSAKGEAWYSAMAQGLGASVLVRAFNLTGDRRYLDTAKVAIEPIFYDLSEGGISVVKDSHYIFPQEYVLDPPMDVLNGSITAYFGVYDYSKASGDHSVKEKADAIINTFADTIGTFDAGFWSYYSHAPQYLASPHYHAVHIAQLRLLYKMSGNEIFKTYANRFESYQDDLTNKAMYLVSNHFRQLKEFELSDVEKIIPAIGEKIALVF